MCPSSPPAADGVAVVAAVSPVTVVADADGEPRDARSSSSSATLSSPPAAPLPAQLFAGISLATQTDTNQRAAARSSGELSLTMLLSAGAAAAAAAAASPVTVTPPSASAVLLSPTSTTSPTSDDEGKSSWNTQGTQHAVHVTVNTNDSMLGTGSPPPAVGLSSFMQSPPPSIMASSGSSSSISATSFTQHVSPYPSFLATGGALTYHLILKKHKQLPRSFPVEMRTTADLGSVLISSHAFNPLTLAPLTVTPVTSSASAPSSLPTETLTVSVLDVIDVCEGVFDVAPDLLAKHVRKTVEGFHQERCFTLFLSHVEHSDKRAHSYAQSSHHHSAATAGHPIPFYFEASSIESMQSWVRSIHYLKEYTAATQPDDRRAQLVKLKRHSQMLRNFGAGSGSSNTLPGLESSPHLQHANTMPAHSAAAPLTHSGSLNAISTHQQPAANHHPLVHSSSSSTFSFIPDAIKRAFHHASSVPSHHSSVAASGAVTPASSPYMLLYDSLRAHKIPLQDGAGDALEDKAAEAMLMHSPLAASTSKTNSNSASSSGSSMQASATPFSPATLPSPLHIDAAASPLSPAPAAAAAVAPILSPAAPAAAAAAAAPILSPAARIAQKTALLTSVLAHGQAFLHYPSRSLEHAPHIMYLWCSPDLNSIGWGPSRSGTPLHSYPSSCISQMFTGVQCEIFGLAKFCFTLVLRVSKAQDHPKEHGRSLTAVSAQTPSSMLSPPSASPTSTNSVAGVIPSSPSVHGSTSPMPQQQPPPRSHGMRGVFEAIRGRHGSWSAQPPTPTVDASNASAAQAATPSAAASPSVSQPYIGTTSLLSLHFATDTLSTLHLWLFALKWLRDAKSNVSTPFNVHRVAWMDTDLKWGGENLMAQFGISPDRDKLVKIGGGGMANVYLITHQSTRQHFALKVFHHYPEVILHEIEIMKRVFHENCVQYYGCMPRGKELYVVLEYCDGGSVADLIRKSKEKMKEQHLSYILRKVLLALQYLHSLSILHRDIKAANILLTTRGEVKLTDFGISEHFVAKTPGAASTPHGSPALPQTPSSILHAGFPASSDGNGSPMTTAAAVASPPAPGASPPTPSALPAFGGSPLFMSPEALRGLELSPATDVYSLGITALEMAEGRPPHSECKTLFAVMQAVLQSPPPSVLTHARSYPSPSDEFIEFVDRCLVHDPTQRWSVDQLLQHPFIAQTQIVSSASATTTTTTTTPHGGVVSTARSFLLRSAAMITSSFASPSLSSPASHTSSTVQTVTVSRAGTESSSSSPHSSVTNSPMLHASNNKGVNSVPNLALALRTTADSNSSPAAAVTQHANPALLQVNWPAAGGNSKSMSRSAHVSPSHSPHTSLDDSALAAIASGSGLASAAGTMGSSTSATCAATKRTSITLASIGVPQSATTLGLPPSGTATGAKSPHISPVLTATGSSHNLHAVNPLALDDAADEAFVSYLAHGTYSRATFHAHPHKHLGAGARRGSGTGTPAPDAHHMQRAASPMPGASPAPTTPRPSDSLAAPQQPARRRSLFGGGSKSRGSSRGTSPNPSGNPALLKKQSHERNLLVSPEAATPVAPAPSTSFTGKLQQMLSITKRTNVEKAPSVQNADALLPPTLFPTAKERAKLEHDEERKLALKQHRHAVAAAKHKAAAATPRKHEGQHMRQFSALPKLLPKLTLKRTASMSTVHAFELATQQPEPDADSLPPLSMPSPSRLLRNQTSPDQFSPIPRQPSAIAEGDEEAESSALTSRHSRSASSLRKYSSARRSSTHGSELAEPSSTRLAHGLLRQDSLLPPYEEPTGHDAASASAEASSRNSPVHEESKEQPDVPDSPTDSPLMQPDNNRQYSYSHSVVEGSAKPKFLKSLKLTSKDTFDQTSTSNSPAVSARNSNKSSSSGATPSGGGLTSALGSPADGSDDTKRPSFKPSLMSSLSLETEEAGDDCPALPSYDSRHDADDGDPFGSERRSLLKRQSSLTQGDNSDMNASYVISSHGTLIAGNFAISAQGLQSATGADGAISRRASTIETVRNRNRKASITPAASLTHGASMVTHASASPLYSRGPSDSGRSDDEDSDGGAEDPDSSPSCREHSLSKEDLFTLGVIGKGQNGQVLKAIHLPSLTRVALKSVYAHNRSTRHQLLHELTAYLSFDSPFLVSFLGAYYEDDVIILATEFADHGSLQRFVQDHGPLKSRPRVFKQVAFQCVAGLKHMHDRHHLHRDIKPDNFLCDHNGLVRLGDFGLLKDLQTTQGVSSTFLGTMSYLSPERIMSGEYSYASDVWSLGLTFLFCLTGVPPPQNPDFFTMMDLITKHPPPQLKVEDGYDADLCDFVNGMVRMAEGERYTCLQLLAHPFLLGDVALAKDEFRLFSLFETRMPQTQRPGDPDSDVWAVGDSNLPDLDLILEFIVKQHLLPELMPSSVRSRSATVVLPPSSSPSVSLSSDSQGATPQGRPVLSTSDGPYTTSMHALQGNSRNGSLDFSSGEFKLGSLTTSESTSRVEDAASLMDTVPLLQLPFGLSVSAAEGSSSLKREHSLTSSGANSFNSSSSDNDPAQQQTGPTVPLPATPASTSTQRQQQQQPQPHSPSSNAFPPSPLSSNGPESSSLPPLPTFHKGNASSSSIVSLPFHDEDDGPSQLSLPSEGPRLMSSNSMSSSIPALPDTPADSPKSSLSSGMHATLTLGRSITADTDTDPDSAAHSSPTSASARPGGFSAAGAGLSLQITADESFEQQLSPTIRIASAVDPSPGASPADSGSPHPSPLSRTAMSLGAAIAAAADDDDGTIQTFSPGDSTGLLHVGVGESTLNSPSTTMHAGSSSVSHSLSLSLSALSSPLPTDGSPIELLQLDSDRCECLSRTFGLTPDQVQAKFLIKQRELLRLPAVVATPTTRP